MSNGNIKTAPEGCVDHHTIDRFTFGHAGVGLAMGLLKAPWWAAVITAIGWEVIEKSLKIARPDLFYQYTTDTIDNSVVDAAAWIVGWGIGYRLSESYPLKKAKSPIVCTNGVGYTPVSKKWTVSSNRYIK